MTYGVGGCTYQWCRVALLSTTQPENTVFALVTECRITQYIPLILPKPNTYISRQGWIYQNKSFPQYVAKHPSAEHTYFKGKTSNLVMIVLQWQQTSCGGSWSDLKQLKGPGTEPAEKDGTCGHPWGEIYRSHTIPSPRLSVKASVPLLLRGTILMEKNAKWRETWVGGMAESDGERKKKMILLCQPDGFRWIKMSNWWKKEDVQRQCARERIK